MICLTISGKTTSKGSWLTTADKRVDCAYCGLSVSLYSVAGGEAVQVQALQQRAPGGSLPQFRTWCPALDVHMRLVLYDCRELSGSFCYVAHYTQVEKVPHGTQPVYLRNCVR